MKTVFSSTLIGGFGGSGIYRWMAGPEWTISGNHVGDTALMILIVMGSILVVRMGLGRLSRSTG